MLHKSTLARRKILCAVFVLTAVAGAASAAYGDYGYAASLAREAAAAHTAAVVDFLVYAAIVLPVILLLTKIWWESRWRITLSVTATLVISLALAATLADSGDYLDTAPMMSALLLLAGIAVLWFGVARYEFGGGKLMSLATGFTVAFSALLAAFPSALKSLDAKAPFLALLMLLAYPAAIGAILVQITLRPPASGSKDALQSQEQTASNRLHTDQAAALAMLKQAERVLREQRANPKRAYGMIQPLISRLSSAQRGIERDLETLKSAGRSLEDLDARHYAALHHRLEHLPPHLKGAVRERLAQARERLQIGQRERQYAQQVTANTAALAQCLQGVLKALKRGNTSAALRQIKRAQSLELEAGKLSNAITASIAQYQQEATRIVTRAALSPEAFVP